MTMWDSIIAVAGTLAGTATAGAITARTAKQGRRDQKTSDAMRAVADLVAAIDAHRAAMYSAGDAKLSGGDSASARRDAHSTRGAISAPLTQVRILAPALGDPAKRAVQATYDMRNPRNRADLDQRRAAAKAAVEALVDAAERHFA
ncbi:protein kilB [Allostreptomyces psammosilenae]|uniref:Protein kilB n=1 Tax=Allostreptomyces psammosilenae TaxID=1892865 RepID=A0A852ZVB4_9ACTN|nr:protein kilB [Allostreptomyces psammosilenae]NYI05567.1 hypothetical protein [Allostreptomyces psammosilenae]